MEGVERFQQQLELVDMIDNEDGGAITAKVKECIEKDPGALEEDALVIDLDEKNSESAKVFMSLKNDDVKIDNEA
jgi:tetrahydromethanopterin S-methyltransferase subunit A